MEIFGMILIGFLIFVIGVLLGGYWFYLLMVNAFTKDPELVLKHLAAEYEEIDDVEEYINAKTNEIINVQSDFLDDCVELTVEKHNSQIYMFFKDTDKFAGQGKTVLEALERVHKRFPGNNFTYSLPDGVDH